MNRIVGCLALSVAIIGCDSTGLTVDDDDGEKEVFPGITVTTPAATEYGRDTIEILPEGVSGVSGMASVGPAAVEGGDGETYNIVQVARIVAPEVAAAGGARVQANDIIVDQSGRTAYIAYNYQGEPWHGALQVVDITKKDQPEVTLEIQFAHMDINALDLDGNRLLIAGAADPSVSGSYLSFVTSLNVQTLDIQKMAENVVGLPSFAATGVARHSNNYYVGVGALGGSIQVLDLDLNIVNEMELADIRDVDHYDQGVIALAGTTDSGNTTGNVIVAASAQFDNPTLLPIVDFGSDFHKATIEVWEGTVALLGLSEAGWKVIDLRSPGSYLYEESNPDCSDTPGLLCNTNSVSTDGNLLFTANGQYGFRVFSPHNKNQFDDYELIGFYNSDVDSPNLPLEEKYSANHVELKAGHLFVASGPRGVFVYTLEKRNP